MLLRYFPKNDFYTLPANVIGNNNLPTNSLTCISVLEDKLFLGHNLGLSISEDGGNTFINKTTANGLASNVVRAIQSERLANNEIRIVVATAFGLSISLDGGETFTNKTIANGLGGMNVESIFVSGQNIYAGTSGGLSISTDGGQSFNNKTIANGLGSNYVGSIFVLGQNIYASTFFVRAFWLCIKWACPKITDIIYRGL